MFFSTFTVALVGAPNASAQAVAQQIGAADASERTTWGIDSQEQWTQATHSSDNLEIEKNRQTNRKVKKRYDKEVYKHRNLIEWFVGRIKLCRRVSTR